jgi:hypothetical protein
MEPLRGSILVDSIKIPPVVAFGYNRWLQTLKPYGLLLMVISMTYAIEH